MQLLTESKMFCGCSTKFGAPPNTQTCPVCIGMPGSLPVMNRKAFELSLKTAVALNCEIPRFTKWDRKNYYYPDLPKGYQISQFDLPLSRNGWLEIETNDVSPLPTTFGRCPERGRGEGCGSRVTRPHPNPLPAGEGTRGGRGQSPLCEAPEGPSRRAPTGGWSGTAPFSAPKRIGIIRAHLEEDAGKSMHDEVAGKADSRIDLNRAGTPLLEIVSEPDLRSPAEAKAYLTELKLLLNYLGVSDCNMQEGSLRVDANINLHIDTPAGQDRHADRRSEKHEQLPRGRAGAGVRGPAAMERMAGDAGTSWATCPNRPAAGTKPRRPPANNAPRRNRATTATFPTPTSCRSR